jgi:hypothetical protein
MSENFVPDFEECELRSHLEGETIKLVKEIKDMVLFFKNYFSKFNYFDQYLLLFVSTHCKKKNVLNFLKIFMILEEEALFLLKKTYLQIIIVLM